MLRAGSSSLWNGRGRPNEPARSNEDKCLRFPTGVGEFVRHEFQTPNAADESTTRDHEEFGTLPRPIEPEQDGGFRHGLRETEAATPTGQPCRDELDNVVVKVHSPRLFPGQPCAKQSGLK